MIRELVTVEDLAELGPAVALRAANPNDTRSRAFLDRYGFSAETECCVEMDAMNPNVARDRVERVVMEMFEGDMDA